MSSQKKYNSEKVKYIKSKIDIVQVVSKDIQLKKHGKNFFGSCPFCNGTHSLSINQPKQFGHCFSCGESFDVIGYFQKVKKLSFAQVISQLIIEINSADDKVLFKLNRAFNRLSDIVNDENKDIINQLKVIDNQAEKLIIDFMLIITDLIVDFDKMELEETIDKSTWDRYYHLFNSMYCGIECTNQTEYKLSNLFKYLVYLCDIIENNDYNLGGLIYKSE